MNSLNITCVFIIITFGAIVRFSIENAFDESVKLVEFLKLHINFL